jgi:hypothetical protein
MDGYEKAFDMMTATVKSMGDQGISRDDLIPALVDLVAALGLIMDGEAGANAIIAHIQKRIEDWKAGRFPSADEKPH